RTDRATAVRCGNSSIRSTAWSVPAWTALLRRTTAGTRAGPSAARLWRRAFPDDLHRASVQLLEQFGVDRTGIELAGPLLGSDRGQFGQAAGIDAAFGERRWISGSRDKV